MVLVLARIGAYRTIGEAGMIWQRVRLALLAAAMVASTLPLRADDKADADKDKAADDKPAAEKIAPPVSAAPAAEYRTICVNEWVPEQYTCTRTVYKTETRTETYTAYRCETVPEQRTRTVTTYRVTCETQMQPRTVVTCVPVQEERTVMKTFWTCKPVTCMVTRCVDRGHYECQEVPCGPTLKERFHKLCSRHSCECEPECPRTKTVKVWVPCKVTEQVPVTRMERVCETRPVTCTVTTYRRVEKQEMVPVTVRKCIPETHTENYTLCVSHVVPFQATRNICVCVPSQETYTATRMVCRTVTKKVPVETCANPCGESCGDCCARVECCKRHRLFGHGH
jgi:hypothetical protein